MGACKVGNRAQRGGLTGMPTSQAPCPPLWKTQNNTNIRNATKQNNLDLLIFRVCSTAEAVESTHPDCTAVGRGEVETGRWERVGRWAKRGWILHDRYHVHIDGRGDRRAQSGFSAPGSGQALRPVPHYSWCRLTGSTHVYTWLRHFHLCYHSIYLLGVWLSVSLLTLQMSVSAS